MTWRNWSSSSAGRTASRGRRSWSTRGASSTEQQAGAGRAREVRYTDSSGVRHSDGGGFYMGLRTYLCVALAIGVAGTAAMSQPGLGVAGAARTDVLIIAKDISDVRPPDPGKGYDVGGVFLQFPIYSRLVKQRAPNFWKIDPDFAESWSVNADATAYTFKLRKDAVFGSGNPVTSEDVRFSLLRAKNIKGYGAFLADPIKTVEVVDAQTARVVLTDPDATFLAALAAGGVSLVDSKTVPAQGGGGTAGADSPGKAGQGVYTHSARAGPLVLPRDTRA